MTTTERIAAATFFMLAVLPLRSAQAQIAGSFDGTLSGKKIPQTLAASATFSQVGSQITGTIALPGDLAKFGGAYLLQGKATPKRIKVSGGGGTGGFLRWTAKISGTTLKGNVKIKAPGAKLVGSLAFTQNPPFATDGSSCDAVYDQNKTLFDDQLMTSVFSLCGTCHAPGFQAAATRLHIDAVDPRATARLVALFVDSANPTASRIAQKPLDLVPHGGGAQFPPGGAEDMLLEQWVGLVAAAHCN
jgi:hypothetical protein